MVDNVSSNDTLITKFADCVAHFGGESSQTWCFLHIINLIAKSLICEFDPLKKNIPHTGTINDKPEEFANLDQEDILTREEDPDKGHKKDNNDKGWVDDVSMLNKEEHAELLEHIMPICVALAKVRK
jgi:hypothetical protein